MTSECLLMNLIHLEQDKKHYWEHLIYGKGLVKILEKHNMKDRFTWF
jgi:hypothetical protein